jgi:hypothetical protein
MTADAGHAVPPDDVTLRALVRDALRDVLPDLLAAARATGPRVEDVAVRDDADLAAFAVRVLAHADDVRSGRLVFRLAGTGSVPAAPSSPPTSTPPSPSSPAPGAGHVVAKGAVTERHVRAAEAAGGRPLLGPRAVLTPLARDRVRASGVQVVRSASPAAPTTATPSPTPRRH